jgi:hypothetical protein
LDFWLYNAFSEEVLKVLKDHHSSLQKVKAVKRGKQFDLFSQGSMIPKGSREAMGGAAGDTYALYAGMDAVSLEDLDSLFNDAEVSKSRKTPVLLIADFVKGFNDSSSSYSFTGLRNIQGSQGGLIQWRSNWNISSHNVFMQQLYQPHS